MMALFGKVLMAAAVAVLAVAFVGLRRWPIGARMAVEMAAMFAMGVGLVMWMVGGG